MEEEVYAAKENLKATKNIGEISFRADFTITKVAPQIIVASSKAPSAVYFFI